MSPDTNPPESARRPAIVYCGHCLTSTRGKTTHGLIRRSDRFEVRSVVDPDHAGRDAGELITGRETGVPILSSVDEAVELLSGIADISPVLVLGMATDGGVLPDHARAAAREGIIHGLDVVAGLHVFLNEDDELVRLADEHGVTLTDVRRPPDRRDLHFYEGRIQDVDSVRILILGTDCASGKRTTAWTVRDALVDAGFTSEMVGTGQTAWMQGARYGIRMDSIVNDFVAGELEHAVVSAWEQTGADTLVVEGQGALLHPAYPGGLELLAAVKPDIIILQHVPARETFDGFPDLPMPPLKRQISAVELLAGQPVDAITVNPSGLLDAQRAWICGAIEREFDRPVVDILKDGAGRIVDLIRPHVDCRSNTEQIGAGPDTEKAD